MWLVKRTQMCYNGNRKEQLQTFCAVSTPLSQMIEEGLTLHHSQLRVYFISVSKPIRTCRKASIKLTFSYRLIGYTTLL